MSPVTFSPGANGGGGCPVMHGMNKLSINGNTHYAIEQLETGEKVSVARAEQALEGCPRHKVGCTPYECHGSLMEKEGFEQCNDSDVVDKKTVLEEAVAFLKQFAHENDGAYDLIGGLDARLKAVEKEIEETGTYKHTFEELEYGCRLAWRNSGRCIMRKVCTIMYVLILLSTIMPEMKG